MAWMLNKVCVGGGGVLIGWENVLKDRNEKNTFGVQLGTRN